MFYDGDGLRGKKDENGAVTYYLRSSVLGGQVVAELNWAGAWVWSRDYVYLGGEILAVQQGGVYWIHQDPAAKSKRITDSSGNVESTIELDPWGGETNGSNNEASSHASSRLTVATRSAATTPCTGVTIVGGHASSNLTIMMVVMTSPILSRSTGTVMCRTIR